MLHTLRAVLYYCFVNVETSHGLVIQDWEISRSVTIATSTFHFDEALLLCQRGNFGFAPPQDLENKVSVH